MSSVAPSESAVSQLRVARALGLLPLRLRGGRAPRKSGPRLQLKLATGEDPQSLNTDPMLQQLLRALGLPASDCVPARAELKLPLLELPALRALRTDAAVRRALWPRLRALRRALSGEENSLE